jgi:hypothetical protein
MIVIALVNTHYTVVELVVINSSLILMADSLGYKNKLIFINCRI